MPRQNYPQNSAMSLRQSKYRTRNVPVGTIGSNELSNPTDKTEEYQKKQAQLEALKQEYEGYNKRKLDEYNAKVEKYKSDLEKYNQEKSEYDKQMVEYNKKLEEYNQQKAAYDEALARYNAEQEANNLAFKLWSNSVYNGVNPTPQYQTPLVQKYLNYYFKRDEVGRANELLAAQKTVSDYQKAYESLDKDIQVYFKNTEQLRKDLAFNPPKLPEGTQGISTPEGIIYQEIPKTPQVIAPTVKQVDIPQNVLRQPLNNALVPTQPNNPFANDIFTQKYNQNKLNYNMPNLQGLNTSMLNVGSGTMGIQPTTPQMQSQFFNLPTLEEAKGKLEVTKAPTIGQMYKYDVKESGYVQGTLNFFGERLAGGYDIAQQKGYTSNYQQEPVRNLLKLSPEAVYFTPVAPILFIGKGVEEVANPKIVKSNDAFLKDYQGFIDIGIGALGVRSEAKLLRENRLLKDLKPAKVEGTFDISTNELNIIASKKTMPTEFDRTFLGIKPREFVVESKIKLNTQ